MRICNFFALNNVDRFSTLLWLEFMPLQGIKWVVHEVSYPWELLSSARVCTANCSLLIFALSQSQCGV